MAHKICDVKKAVKQKYANIQQKTLSYPYRIIQTAPDSYDLKNLLAQYSTDELKEVINVLMTGLSKNMRKESLVSGISEDIVKSFAVFLRTVNEDMFQLIFSLRNNKISVLKDFIGQSTYIKFLLKRGYLFRCRHQNEELLIFPEELKNIMDMLDGSEMMTIVKTNSIVCKMGDGILYYYGVLKHDAFFTLLTSILKHYNNGSADIKVNFSKLTRSDYYLNNPLYKETEPILSNYFEYGTKIKASRFYSKYHDIYYSYYTVFDPYNIFYEQQKNKDIDFLTISCNDILKEHQGDNKAKKAMCDNLINTLGISRLKADMLVEEWSCYVKNAESPAIYTELILEQIDFKSASQVNDLFLFSNRYFVNALSQWTIKGHDPNGSMKSDTEVIKNTDKIGRNAPCPCGSGKKYKKCCGK